MRRKNGRGEQGVSYQIGHEFSLINTRTGKEDCVCVCVSSRWLDKEWRGGMLRQTGATINCCSWHEVLKVCDVSIIILGGKREGRRGRGGSVVRRGVWFDFIRGSNSLCDGSTSSLVFNHVREGGRKEWKGDV